MNILLKEAIQAQRLVEITSHGVTYLAEPYCYGKVWTGHEALRVYIVQAPTESPVTPGWHLFLMSDIQYLHVLQSLFEEIRTDFDAYDLAMFFIYCRVEKQRPVSQVPETFTVNTLGGKSVRAYI